jgi:hypothetical protein
MNALMEINEGNLTCARWRAGGASRARNGRGHGRGFVAGSRSRSTRSCRQLGETYGGRVRRAEDRVHVFLWARAAASFADGTLISGRLRSVVDKVLTRNVSPTIHAGFPPPAGMFVVAPMSKSAPAQSVPCRSSCWNCMSSSLIGQSRPPKLRVAFSFVLQAAYARHHSLIRMNV